MKWKLVLPALEEAQNEYYRSIKYSLFPPLGLASLAGYIPEDHDVIIVDEHVESIAFNDEPDVVCIQVYITNSKRSYELADHYLTRGKIVILGGLHVTSLPDEARQHASAIVIGPGDHIFGKVVQDVINGRLKPQYQAQSRTLNGIPVLRRGLIKRYRYLIPNSIVVSRGCPYSCDFCYVNNFFGNGKSYYTYKISQALSEIDSLKGKHLFFLDDNLLTENKFTVDLFMELKKRNRICQGAGTVKSILNEKLIHLAAEAGLKSLFVGFESINKINLKNVNKKHNVYVDYDKAIDILHYYGIKINGSFVFGMDDDEKDVFERTTDWAIEKGMTTATFHVLTPYPGTPLYNKLASENRILTRNWTKYNTRNVVFKPARMSVDELERGYWNSYTDFYKYSSIWKSAMIQGSISRKISSLAYSIGWKKIEPLWEFMVKYEKLKYALPLFVSVLRR